MQRQCKNHSIHCGMVESFLRHDEIKGYRKAGRIHSMHSSSFVIGEENWYAL